MGFNEIKKTDEKFNEWIQNLSYDDFLSHLTRLNGVIRETSINKRLIDGQNVELTLGGGGIAYLPPEQAKKDELMREGFNALKDLSNNEERAKLAYYLIQAIHPYSDGNGRLGRLLYEMINNDELNKDTLSKLLDHNKKDSSGTGEGRNAFYKKLLTPREAYYLINREVVKEFLSKDFLEKYGGINIELNTPPGYGLLTNKVKDKLSNEEVILGEKILDEEDVPTFSFRDISLAKLIIEDEFLKKTY